MLGQLLLPVLPVLLSFFQLSCHCWQEKEPVHLTGDGGRFHGLLSQRAIEVLWLGFKQVNLKRISKSLIQQKVYNTQSRTNRALTGKT